MADPSESPEPAPSEADQGKSSRGEGPSKLVPWIPLILFVATAIAALYVGKIFLDRASDETDPLSNLEQTFFGVYTLIVGGALSWVISHVYARRETRERFEQLARPALRRVVAARESAEGLLAAVDRRQQGAESTEAFDSLRELVLHHARTLDDAISDWQELLPAEVVRAQVAAELGAQSRHAIELRDVKEQLAILEERQQTQQSPDPEIAVLRKTVKRLSDDMEASRHTGLRVGGIHTYSGSLDSSGGLKIAPTAWTTELKGPPTAG